MTVVIDHTTEYESRKALENDGKRTIGEKPLRNGYRLWRKRRTVDTSDNEPAILDLNSQAPAECRVRHGMTVVIDHTTEYESRKALENDGKRTIGEKPLRKWRQVVEKKAYRGHVRQRTGDPRPEQPSACRMPRETRNDCGHRSHDRIRVAEGFGKMMGKEPHVRGMWEYLLQERNKVKRFPELGR